MGELFLHRQRGGGYWKSGKEGNLNSHAKDVLNKPPSKPKGTVSVTRLLIISSATNLKVREDHMRYYVL